MPDLRQRQRSRRSTQPDSNDEKEIDPFLPGAGLSARAMIDAAPQHHGSVQKLHIPVIYSILPSVLQRLILSSSCLKFMAPSWKQRHLILCGSYLYKFKDTTASVPKGRPFEVEGIAADVLRTKDQKVDFSEIGNLPSGYTSIFKVSNLRRCHYYGVSDEDEAMLWVRSLGEARQEVITRNMGHASNVPYPFSWKHFDSLGKSLLKSKNRVKERMERSSTEDMEMTAFTDGQISRGFYG